MQIPELELCVALIETAPAAYLTTIDADGYPHTRAMLNLRNREQYPNHVHLYAAHQDDLMIYFSTNTSSAKVAQIRANPRVSVYYCHPTEFHGVMLGGDAEIMDDPELQRAIWNEGWEQYYPGGPDDPDNTVLRLYPTFVEGWYRGKRFEFRLDRV